MDPSTFPFGFGLGGYQPTPEDKLVGIQYFLAMIDARLAQETKERRRANELGGQFAHGQLTRASESLERIAESFPERRDSLLPTQEGVTLLLRSLEDNPQIRKGNKELKRLNEQVGDLRHEVRSGLDRLEETFADKVDYLADIFAEEIDALREEISDGFEAVVREQTLTRKAIVRAIRNEDDRKMKNLRRDARTVFFAAAAKSDPKEQVDDWKNARAWYERVVDKDVGLHDLESHFNLGWLEWRVFQDLGRAEEQFRACVRHAENFRQTDDPFYQYALWHLAHMRYLEKDCEEAYLVVRRATDRFRKTPYLFDHARYAALTGRRGEALSVLEECVRLQPAMLYAAFAENDFAFLRQDIAAMAVRLQREEAAIHHRLTDRLDRCLTRLRSAERALNAFQLDVSFLSRLASSVGSVRRSQLGLRLDYPGYRAMMPVFQRQVEEAEKSTEEAVGTTKAKLQELKKDMEKRLADARQEAESHRLAEEPLSTEPARPSDPPVPKRYSWSDHFIDHILGAALWLIPLALAFGLMLVSSPATTIGKAAEDQYRKEAPAFVFQPVETQRPEDEGTVSKFWREHVSRESFPSVQEQEQDALGDQQFRYETDLNSAAAAAGSDAYNNFFFSIGVPIVLFCVALLFGAYCWFDYVAVFPSLAQKENRRATDEYEKGKKAIEQQWKKDLGDWENKKRRRETWLARRAGLRSALKKAEEQADTTARRVDAFVAGL